MSADPRLLVIEDGVMLLRGIENDDTDKDAAPYLTAGVTSRRKYSVRYGKVQIRARCKSAQGAWPGFGAILCRLSFRRPHQCADLAKAQPA